MTFGKWSEEIHGGIDQEKRIKSAKSAKTTPLSVDKEALTGVFPGSGKEPYQVSLESCTCGDFRRRGLPCKHIYRLAMECGLIRGEYAAAINPRQDIRLDEAVGTIENFSEDAQIFLKQLLQDVPKTGASSVWVETNTGHSEIRKTSCYITRFHPIAGDCIFSVPFFELLPVPPEDIVPSLLKSDLEGILSKARTAPQKKLLKKDLAVWCLENIPNLADYVPERYFVNCAPSFQNVRAKCIQYLRRKYDMSFAYTEKMVRIEYPFGAQFLDIESAKEVTDSGYWITHLSSTPSVCVFPDDDITAMLTLYGCNRCLNGYKVAVDE